MNRLDPYIGSLKDLQKEIVARSRANTRNVRQKALDFVEACGCSVVVLDRLEGRGPMEMIAPPTCVQDTPKGAFKTR